MKKEKKKQTNMPVAENHREDVETYLFISRFIWKSSDQHSMCKYQWKAQTSLSNEGGQDIPHVYQLKSH